MFSVTTDSFHFQSADALALAELPGGDLLAATFDRSGVATWRLPAPGALQSLGLAALPAERLGGFEAGLALDCAMYTVALSPCRRWLAAGGENGAIAVYSLDSAAPPRPPLPPGKQRVTGVIFHYTPRLTTSKPASLGAMIAAMAAEDAASSAEEAGPSSAGQRQQEQERQQDAAVMLAGIIGTGWSSEAEARQSYSFNDATAMVNG